MGLMMAAGFDDVCFSCVAAARESYDEKSDDKSVHDGADREEDPEQGKELAVLGRGSAEVALIMLVRTCAEKQRENGCSSVRPRRHCWAASEVLMSPCGVRV